jgi:two-component sensor histidine kinase
VLTNELEHRVRNTLAIVQAIVDQTFRSTEGDAIREVLGGRIAALAAAHGIISNSRWRDAPIREVVTSALAPHQTPDKRIRFSGPALSIDARQCLSLSLALHELATNAVKYGALSKGSGRVHIVWKKESTAETVQLFWQESGGPPLMSPTRKGFGSRLIETSFGGSGAIDYRPDGLRCRLELGP